MESTHLVLDVQSQGLDFDRRAIPEQLAPEAPIEAEPGNIQTPAEMSCEGDNCGAPACKDATGHCTWYFTQGVGAPVCGQAVEIAPQ